MSYLFPMPARSGKTVAAGKFTFVPKGSMDVLRACAFFGGSMDSMKPIESEHVAGGRVYVHNYIPLLNTDEFIPDESYAVALDSILGQNGAIQEVPRELRNGMWYKFEDGYYTSSALCAAVLPDISKLLQAKGTWPVDADGLGVKLYKDPNDKNADRQPIKATYMILYRGDSNGREVTDIFIRGDFAVGCRGVRFDGVPYIQVTETAVNAPAGVLAPKFIGIKSDSVAANLARQLADVVRDELKNMPTKTVQTIGQLFTQQHKNVYDAKQAMDAFVQFDPFEQYARAATEVLQSEGDWVFPDAASGVVLFKKLLALTILFGSSRCFVDAITTLALTAGGTAIAGGVSGAFLSALQQTTRSECILVYSLSTTEDRSVVDPMEKYDPEGLVNGVIFSNRKSGKWLSDSDIVLNTRNSTRGRNVFYYFVNQKEHLVYSNDWVHNFETGETLYNPGVGYSDENMLSKLPSGFTPVVFRETGTIGKKTSIDIPEEQITFYGVRR